MVSGGMTPPDRDTKTELEDILFACLEAEDASAALERACEEHPQRASQLRKAYESLRQHELVGSADSDSIPERLGRYRLVERLGEGGMGVVFLADDEELGRRVALKLIRPEHLWFENSRERFRREVEAAARLQHPGIAAVYDYGEERGLPYFSMEYVSGVSVADVLTKLLGRDATTLRAHDLGADPGDVPSREQTWPVAIAKLTRAVALALEHAHARGVVHRDIKPSNVLIDEDGQARLVDFGLAGLEDATALTRTNAEVGSLPYMPPEIVSGQMHNSGAALDIYSLGVSLYEMLTLISPFLARTGQKTRSRILDHEYSPLRSLNSQVPRDLETICAKMMDASPERRYASCAEVADELQRFLEQRPVQARRAGSLLRVWRWAQRRPALAAASVFAFVLFCVVPVAFGVYQSSVAEEAADLEAIARANSYVANVSAAQQYLVRSEVAAARRHLDSCPEELRAWEWRYLRARLDDSEMLLSGHEGPIQGVAIVGADILSASRDGTVRRWREDGSNEVLARYPDWVLAVAPFRRGALWGGNNGELWQWVDGAEPVRRLRLEGKIEEIAVAPDSRHVAIGLSSGGVLLWDSETERRVELHAGSSGMLPVPCFAVCFDESGRLFSTAGKHALCWDRPTDPSKPRRIGAWDAVEGGTPAIEHRSWVYELAARDGVLWTFDEVGVFCRWDVQSGRPLQLPERFRDGSLNAVVFTKEDVAMIGSSRPILRLESGRVTARYMGHLDDVLDLAFDDARSRVVSSSRDGTLRVWSSEPPQRVFGHRKSVNVVAPLRDGERIVTVCSDRKIRVWNAVDGSVEREIEVGVRAKFLALSEDEGHAIAVGEGVALEVDLSGVGESRPFARGLAAAWCGDGVAAVLARDRVQVWRPDESSPSAEFVLEDSDSPLRVIAAHGGRLATGSLDGSVHAWSADPLRRDELLCKHDERVSAIMFSPDGSLVLSASYDGHVKFTRVADGRPARADVVWAGATLQCMALHPDGSRIALGAINQPLAGVWDLDRAEPLIYLSGHGRAVLSLAFTRDGRDLITGSWDATARTWSTAE